MDLRLAAASRKIGRPDYVLLCTYGCSDAVDINKTTSCVSLSKMGCIKVTISKQDLPSISYFHVTCPDLTENPFTQSPEILWSSENFILFRVHLVGPGPPEFFLYMVEGPEFKRPMLSLLPDFGSYCVREMLDPYLVGVVPDDDGKSHFVTAFKRKESADCELHIYRLEGSTGTWSKEHIFPDFPSWARSGVFPDKVVALGQEVGYVDLLKGILFCNVVKNPVKAHFIPLPNLLPNNQHYFYEELPGQAIRDVTCTDGYKIMCVELEDLFGFTTRIPDPDVLHDFEVDPSMKVVKHMRVGWRLVTWYREIFWDHWQKVCKIHVDELGEVSLPPHGRTEPLPPKNLKPSSRAKKLPLSDLQTACPILCGDYVCLLSKWDYRDDEAWIVTVDMWKKAVRGLVRVKDGISMRLNPAYISFVMKNYRKGESDGRSSLVKDTPFHGKRCLFPAEEDTEGFDNGTKRTIWLSRPP
ncbi:unnamed protein product [Triticum turgidum subsp. durum]|uniref:DUF1618 domain-containing protein n=2 Tax=Triticum turgidum subsp. durum TaxID=4567 RepID=A0A9R0YPC0_TRITD|nr:unnamed protein product [Triticum turgidum subsp. durum]